MAIILQTARIYSNAKPIKYWAGSLQLGNTANLTSVQYNFDTIHVDDNLFNED